MTAGSTNTRLPYRVKNIVGQKFGRLTVVKFAGTSAYQFAQWECQCICGKRTLAVTSELNSGHKKSCGCLYHDSRKTCARIHGGCTDGSTDPEYGCWQGMMKRCYNPKH